MKRGKLWHWLFLVAIFFKGLDGLLEVSGGLILLFLSHTSLIRYVNFLFSQELSERPSDPVIQYLFSLTHISENTQLFAGIYMLGHGLVKVGIVTGLYFRKLWVYPLAEVILIAFIVYQSWRFAHTHSPLLLFLTLVDAVIIFLIYKEYIRLKTRDRL
jgi:uncharacterized membrane protein